MLEKQTTITTNNIDRCRLKLGGSALTFPNATQFWSSSVTYLTEEDGEGEGKAGQMGDPKWEKDGEENTEDEELKEQEVQEEEKGKMKTAVRNRQMMTRCRFKRMCVSSSALPLGFILLMNIFQPADSKDAGRDYCNMEIFEARCGRNTSGQFFFTGHTQHTGLTETAEGMPRKEIGRAELGTSGHKGSPNSWTGANGSLIVMTSARYGRMNAGRCVSSEFGHIGCEKDVLELMDLKCSGRIRCRIKIPDDEMYAMNVCPLDATAYLQASYACFQVPDDYVTRCTNGQPVLMTSHFGYVTNAHAGVQRCRWRVELSRGLTINVTLLDFGVISHVSAPTVDGGLTQPPICYKYAIIRELSSAYIFPSYSSSSGPTSFTSLSANGPNTVLKPQPVFTSRTGRAAKETLICSGSRRERHVYLSETNAIDIQTMIVGDVRDTGSSDDVNDVRYILKYNAVGCSDPKVPDGGFMMRSKDIAIIYCDNSTTQSGNRATDTRQQRRLQCVDGQWTGDLVVLQCSQQRLNTEKNRNSDSQSVDLWTRLTTDWTTAVILTAGLGVGIGVVVGLTMLFLLHSYCKRRDLVERVDLSDSDSSNRCGCCSNPTHVVKNDDDGVTVEQLQYKSSQIGSGPLHLVVDPSKGTPPPFSDPRVLWWSSNDGEELRRCSCTTTLAFAPERAMGIDLTTPIGNDKQFVVECCGGQHSMTSSTALNVGRDLSRYERVQHMYELSS